jgi:hypothetical protein
MPPMRLSPGSLIVTVICSLLLTACANDADLTRGEGAGVGAVAGGVLAKILGAKTGGVIGAAAGGAVVGLIAGDQVAKKKATYASNEDQLRASAQKAQDLAQQTRAYNDQLKQQIAALTQSRDQLNQQVMDAQARNKIAQANKQKTTALIRQTNTQLASVRQEIANQQHVIDTASANQDKSAQNSADIERVADGVTALQVQERALQQAEAQLKLIDQRRAY